MVDQHPVINANTTNTSTQTPINTDQTSTSTTSNTTNTTTNTTTITFTAYEHKYIGNDILTQYTINEALKLSYNLVQSDQYWNHTVTMIVETCKVLNII